MERFRQRLACCCLIVGVIVWVVIACYPWQPVVVAELRVVKGKLSRKDDWNSTAFSTSSSSSQARLASLIALGTHRESGAGWEVMCHSNCAGLLIDSHISPYLNLNEIIRVISAKHDLNYVDLCNCCRCRLVGGGAVKVEVNDSYHQASAFENDKLYFQSFHWQLIIAIYLLLYSFHQIVYEIAFILLRPTNFQFFKLHPWINIYFDPVRAPRNVKQFPSVSFWNNTEYISVSIIFSNDGHYNSTRKYCLYWWLCLLLCGHNVVSPVAVPDSVEKVEKWINAFAECIRGTFPRITIIQNSVSKEFASF